MTDQSQFPAPIGDEPTPSTGQPPAPQAQPQPYGDWREQRRAERAEWRVNHQVTHNSSSTSWIGGLIIIAIGVILLAQNLIPGFYLHNWWALFILIPAIGSLAGAFSQYRAAGRVTPAVRGSLTGGLLLSFVAAIFLFDWSWGKLWPVFIIFAGLAILFNTLSDRK